jgi:hypothetical protein
MPSQHFVNLILVTFPFYPRDFKQGADSRSESLFLFLSSGDAGIICPQPLYRYISETLPEATRGVDTL